jgi:hypothetical protein
MSKFIILIAMLLASLHSNAQMTLEDFYKPGSTWCEEKVVGVGHGTYYIAAKYEWRIDVDTTINSTSYHKVSNYGKTYGGLRVSNDTVFFYRTDTTNYFGTNGPALGTEVVLYKFDLQIGDVITWRYAGNSTITNITTTQLTSGEVVNHYWFDSYESWVYGIGGNRGLFDAYIAGTGPYFMLSYTSPAAAYSFPFSYPVQQGRPVGSNGPFTPCFPTKVGDVLSDESTVSIYPNPITTKEMNIAGPAIAQLRITDITGKLLYTNSNLPEGKHTIPAPATQGIYMLSAQLADGTLINRKIIKQ